MLSAASLMRPISARRDMQVQMRKKLDARRLRNLTQRYQAEWTLLV